MIEAPPAGHIKVSRKVFDAEHGDPFWMEERQFSRWEAWIDLIQLAAWKRSQYRTAGGVVRLDRGQLIASLRLMARRWGWTVKRVRGFMNQLEKSDRIRAQEGHTSGTIYLITKYDAYQSTPEPKGTGEGIGGAQQGHKIEAVKAVSTSPAAPVEKKKRPAASASAANLDAFPEATCSAGFERWVSRFGAMNYGRFRNALLPLFQARPRCYDADQLAAAVDAFHDAKGADDARFQGKWTVTRFAGELHQWVKLGAMEYVDDYGLPTERGRVAGIFAA